MDGDYNRVIYSSKQIELKDKTLYNMESWDVILMK